MDDKSPDAYDYVFDDDKLYSQQEAIERGAFANDSSIYDAVKKGKLSPGTRPGVRRLRTGLEYKQYLRNGQR